MTEFKGAHRSHDPQLSEIRDEGVFGGLFASTDGGMDGEHIYEISSPQHLTDYALNYEIEGAWEAALELCDGDEDRAERIMSAGCESDSSDPDDGWELQRLRGQLASRLGYTSVEIEDETGSGCALCLPGCTIIRSES